jgi:hypothetical protein
VVQVQLAQAMGRAARLLMALVCVALGLVMPEQAVP